MKDYIDLNVTHEYDCICTECWSSLPSAIIGDIPADPHVKPATLRTDQEWPV